MEIRWLRWNEELLRNQINRIWVREMGGSRMPLRFLPEHLSLGWCPLRWGTMGGPDGSGHIPGPFLFCSLWIPIWILLFYHLESDRNYLKWSANLVYLIPNSQTLLVWKFQKQKIYKYKISLHKLKFHRKEITSWWRISLSSYIKHLLVLQGFPNMA